MLEALQGKPVSCRSSRRTVFKVSAAAKGSAILSAFRLLKVTLTNHRQARAFRGPISLPLKIDRHTGLFSQRSRPLAAGFPRGIDPPSTSFSTRSKWVQDGASQDPATKR